MPTYEFLCESCNKEFEEFLWMYDPIPEECPHCKTKGKIKRLISGAIAGIVVLGAQEEQAKIAKDVKEMKHRVRTDEKYRENLFGKG